MSKSARGLLQLLYVKKLRIVFLALFVVLISAIIFFVSISPSEPDTAEITERINGQCQEGSDARCLKSFFAEYALNHNFDKSKALLDELQKINPRTKYCHAYAHAISIAEVEKDAENWLEVFSYVPSSECSYGFFHGVIEGKYRSDPDFIIDNHFIDSVCLKNTEVQGFSRSCAHAFGHVLLVQQRGVVNEALLVCEKLLSGLVDPCFQGVFMENIQRENLAEHGISQREDWDQKFLEGQIAYCNVFSGSKLHECWRSLGPLIRAAAKNEEGLAVCQSAPEYLSRRFCSREVGGERLVRIFSEGSEFGKSDDGCLYIDNNSNEYRNCLGDLVSYVLLTSSSFKNDMLIYCQGVKINEREYCKDQVENFN